MKTAVELAELLMLFIVTFAVVIGVPLAIAASCKPLVP